jgi:hypothetical protein
MSAKLTNQTEIEAIKLGLQDAGFSEGMAALIVAKDYPAPSGARIVTLELTNTCQAALDKSDTLIVSEAAQLRMLAQRMGWEMICRMSEQLPTDMPIGNLMLVDTKRYRELEHYAAGYGPAPKVVHK